MNKERKLNYIKAIFLVSLALVITTACEPDHSDAVPASLPTTPEVFIDGFSAGLDFSAFGDSKVSAFQVDNDITYEKSDASMRFDVPSAGDPESGYAGGVFFDEGGRNLSDYNVLSFWGRASQAATIQELGFGGEDTRTSIENVAFSTAWTQYFIILPLASRLTEENVMFFFVDTPDNGDGYSFWIDDLKYENLGTIGQVRPVIQNGNAATIQAFVGQVLSPSGLGLSFSLPNGVDQPVNAAPAYFSLSSSTEAASIRLNETTNAEEIVVASEGEAVITAMLGDIEAEGSLTLNISEFEPAPVPMRDSTSVISIFSDAYENVPVDFYNGFYAPFQTTESADFTVNGDNVLNYVNYNFVGIEFNQNVPTIDGTNMTHLHVDIYIPDDFDPASTLRINLRDFGADDSFDGGDDAIVSLVISANTVPALVKSQWISIDFDISGLINKQNLGQIVFDAESNESPRPSAFFVDNIYLYNEDGGMGGGEPILPTEPAPTPTQAEADVISIYSDAYTDVPNDGFNLYGNAAFEEVQIQSDGALKYTQVGTDGGNFQVIELGGGNQLNVEAAGMTNFRFDAWFPNPVNMGTTFLMKVVDIPMSGATEALINVNASSNPAIAQGQWLSFDIPIAELESNGLGGKMNIQQVVVDLMNSGEVYLDNIYFYKGEGGTGGGPIAPTEPAPAPTQAEADVISIYSDAYIDVPRDGFNLYGAAAFEEVQIQGDGALRYTFVDTDGGNFQVIELGGNQLDVETAGMTNFRFDAWFSNAVDMNATFLMKVVDIPGSGPTEAQINVNASSNPAIAQGQWLSFDIPISELEANGLGGKMNIQQVVVDLMNSGEVYLDNIYFYNGGGSGGDDPIPPSEPAPAPTQAEADVISIYSDAYMDVPKDGFNFYGAADFEEVQIQGDGALRYTFVDVGGGNFQVIELGGNQLDVETAGMTNFRFDAWFSNAGDMNATFLMKVVDIPGSGPTEAQINVNASSNPAIAQGQWLSFDIPIAELESNGLGGKMNIQQVVVDLMNSGEVYLDNIYFYKEDGGMGGGPIAPTEPAPAPTQAEADVISIYSDAYTDVPRDGFNFYGAAAFEEVQIQGDGALKYTFVDVGGGNFQVIELGGNQLDVETAGMTNFRFDAWFPNELDMSSTFLMKVVDISASGATEALINVNASSNPAIAQGQWLSFDIPIAELESNGLGGKMNIQQVVVDLMNSGEVYLDNIYFYK